MFRHTSSEVIYDYFHLVAANQFLRYLNIGLAHIKFTVEFEENNTISFLDILIKHSNHSFSTSIFIAKWDSFTPRKYKINLIRTLTFRFHYFYHLHLENTIVFYRVRSKITHFRLVNLYPIKHCSSFIKHYAYFPTTCLYCFFT